MHDAVRFEQGIDVAGGAARVVGEGHRGTAEHVQVCDDASPGEPLAEEPARVLDGGPVEQR